MNFSGVSSSSTPPDVIVIPDSPPGIGKKKAGKKHGMILNYFYPVKFDEHIENLTMDGILTKRKERETRAVQQAARGMLSKACITILLY
jgi:hypothetical protein